MTPFLMLKTRMGTDDLQMRYSITPDHKDNKAVGCRVLDLDDQSFEQQGWKDLSAAPCASVDAKMLFFPVLVISKLF